MLADLFADEFALSVCTKICNLAVFLIAEENIALNRKDLQKNLLSVFLDKDKIKFYISF